MSNTQIKWLAAIIYLIVAFNLTAYVFNLMAFAGISLGIGFIIGAILLYNTLNKLSE